MEDVLILGSGPAGVSAALYTARAGLRTLIVTRGGGALVKTGRVGNYYGFAEPISGEDLLKNGEEQAALAGARFVREEAVGAAWDGGRFTVRTAANEYRAPFLVLATGAARRAPDLPGLARFEGCGVSYCAVCDAFFYRGKPVAVLGGGAYALHEAAELRSAASRVAVLTDGAEPSVPFPEEFEVCTAKIAGLYGDAALRGVRFADGTSLEAAGLFVALGVAGGTDLARKLGAEIRGTAVATDERRRTNVPGLYAAGDCAGGLLQIAKAVCDGAVAGTSVVREFRASRKNQK